MPGEDPKCQFISLWLERCLRRSCKRCSRLHYITIDLTTNNGQFQWWKTFCGGCFLLLSNTRLESDCFVEGLRIWIPKNIFEIRTVSIKQTRWSGPKVLTCWSLFGGPGPHAGKNPDTCAICEMSESAWWHEMFGLPETKNSRIEGSPDTICVWIEGDLKFFQARLMNPSILNFLLWGYG